MKQRLAFAFAMSLVMTILMTCWVTFLHLGSRPDFLLHWGKAFVMAWPIAGLVSFTFGPLVQRWAARFTPR